MLLIILLTDELAHSRLKQEGQGAEGQPRSRTCIGGLHTGWRRKIPLFPVSRAIEIEPESVKQWPAQSKRIRSILRRSPCDHLLSILRPASMPSSEVECFTFAGKAEFLRSQTLHLAWLSTPTE
jgi:hypothetical protein